MFDRISKLMLFPFVVSVVATCLVVIDFVVVFFVSIFVLLQFFGKNKDFLLHCLVLLL